MNRFILTGVILLVSVPSLAADYKVVRKTADQAVVAFGSNTSSYQPVVKAGEALTIEPSVPSLSPQPDVAGLKVWLKANMTFTLRNAVAKAYPNFLVDLTAGDWPEFQAGVIQARTDVPLNWSQWAAFKGAITTYNIPVTLP